jgi:voltage-gated potassium channel Kch
VSALFSGTKWGGVLTAALVGATLLYAMKTSRVDHRLRRTGYVIAPVLVVSAFVAAIGGGRLADALVPGVIAVLVLAAIASIMSRAREHTTITIRTVFGALCLYLMIGLFYSALFPMIAVLADQPFFAQAGARGSVDYLYFSYVTMSTVGYGDLTAASNLGKMLAVSEALIGQMFLVTVVALVVTNIGRSRRRPETDADD